MTRTMPLTFRELRDRLEGRTALAAAPPPQRKDQAALSATEQGRFQSAVNLLNQRGFFGPLVSIHSDMSHTMHNMPGDPTSALGQQRFLPWHRVYLYQLEQQLQNFDPDVTIPYWDWTKAEEQKIPRWLQGVTLTVAVTMPDPGMGLEAVIPVSVIRAPLTQEILHQTVSSIDEVMLATTYTDFATRLENIHNGVHAWVGGTMNDLLTAPADPIFWMHHANIDRLWWKWQQSHKGQDPDVTGVDAIMDPWRYDEPSTRDIANFNYQYA
jgi:hypothetical protein